MVTQAEIERMAALMDALDVPAEDRIVHTTRASWRKLLWLQTSRWRRWSAKLLPWLFPHDWRPNASPDLTVVHGDRVFNYLVCRKCGEVTDHFDFFDLDEFHRWYRAGGCLR